MRSVITGWWSWLVAIWALAALAISVIALFGDDGDDGAHRVAFALIFLGFASLTATALVVRRKAPRLAAWLLVVGVGLPGLPGIGSIWMSIPTAIALVIIVGGVRTGEVRFRQPEPAGEG